MLSSVDSYRWVQPIKHTLSMQQTALINLKLTLNALKLYFYHINQIGKLPIKRLSEQKKLFQYRIRIL